MNSKSLTHSSFKSLWLIIGVIVLLNIIGAYWANNVIISIFKPLISLSLVYYAFKMQRVFSLVVYRSLIIALLCGLLGDIALMPATQFDQSFLVGLVCFLLGHIAYIHVFYKLGKSYQPSIAKQALALGLCFWAVWMYAKLYPSIPGLEIPVFVYCFILILLALFAVFSQNTPGYMLRLIGVLIFVISDSTLAWGAFIHSSNILNAFVIATYSLAQIFIVHGVIQNKLSK